MKSKPLVSIITPSYNQGKFIEETIQSVLNQTYENIEYIIVDACSTDDTSAILEKYSDKVDTIIQESDNGQTDAINKGFKIAHGELIGWLGSDDLLYPRCVENIVEMYIKTPNGSVYYNCQNNNIDDDGNIIRTYTKKVYSRNYLLKQNYDVLQQGSFYPNELVKKVGYLDESIYYCMDLDLWLKLSNEAPIIYSDKPPLSAFRIWSDTKTSTGNDKFLKNIREVLLKHGASYFSKTVIKTYKSTIKFYIKKYILRIN